MQDPDLTIIVPVYNAEHVLHRCLDSISNQSHKNFELLLIDDGSKDRSGSICDDYARNDVRIKVFHQQNGGPSKARNFGLDNAKGEWVCFIDSDDWVEQDYIKHFISCPDLDGTTLVVQSFYNDFIDDKARILRSKRDDEAELDISGKDSILKLMSERSIFNKGYPFAKMYNKQIIHINNIRFDEQVHYSEDMLFFLNYIRFANRLILSKSCLYHYTIAGNSLSNKYHNFDSELRGFNELKTALSTLDPKGENGQRAIGANARCGLLLTRTIESMYRPGTFLDRSERLKNLQSLHSAENAMYYSEWNKHNIKTLNATLFEKRLFSLMDVVLLMQFRTRYLLDPVWAKYVRNRKTLD